MDFVWYRPSAVQIPDLSRLFMVKGIISETEIPWITFKPISFGVKIWQDSFFGRVVSLFVAFQASGFAGLKYSAHTLRFESELMAGKVFHGNFMGPKRNQKWL